MDGWTGRRKTYDAAREKQYAGDGVQRDGHDPRHGRDEERREAGQADQHAEAAREGAVPRRDGRRAEDLLADEGGGQGEDRQGDEELGAGLSAACARGGVAGHAWELLYLECPEAESDAAMHRGGETSGLLTSLEQVPRSEW